MTDEFCSWWLFATVGTVSLFFALLTTITINQKLAEAKTNDSAINVLFLLTVLPLYIMIAFTDSGIDYYNYYDHIQFYGKEGYSEKVYMEPLFFYTAKWITSITGSIHFYLFLLKSTTIIVFFLSIYIIKEKINFFFSVLAYLAIIYPGSFYIIRQAFSGSLLCYAFVLFTFKNKRFIPIILMAIAMEFHYTAAVYLCAFPLCMLLKTQSPQKTKIGITLSFVGTFIILIAIFTKSSLLSYFSSAHYEEYMVVEQTYEGSGLLQFIYYIPAFFFILLLIKDESKRSLVLLFLIFTEISFICAELGYIIPVFIRMRYFSSVVFSIIIPYVLQTLCIKTESEPEQHSWNFFGKISFALYAFLIVYFTIRIVFDIAPLLQMENDSQLYWYHPMNPLF